MRTDVASAGSAFKGTRKVKVLSIQRRDVITLTINLTSRGPLLVTSIFPLSF